MVDQEQLLEVFSSLFFRSPSPEASKEHDFLENLLENLRLPDLPFLLRDVDADRIVAERGKGKSAGKV